MAIDELAEKLAVERAWVPGKRVKLELRDRGSVLLDGEAGKVSAGDGRADTVISASWDDWKAIAAGDLDPVGAFMNGRLRVEGDLSAAMQLQAVLGRALAGD